MVAQIPETVLKLDRVIVLAGLLIICALAWAYVLQLASSVAGMVIVMPAMAISPADDLGLTFLMWAVMMVAMMTPSADPMLLNFARVRRQREKGQTPVLATLPFLLGYLVAWIAFSAGATLFQAGLDSAALLAPETLSAAPLLGGILLLAAGVYQFTSLKHSCLTRCRTPLGFLMTEWREGTMGALVMGLRHGLYCIGCCWLLMSLLFVAGVMNLLWVALIAVSVLTEKVFPAGVWVSRAIGVFTVAWGAAWLLRVLTG